MKLWKRFGAALLAALTLTASLTGPALAAEPERSPGIAVQMDGKTLSFTDAAPEITDDRTFLPFRAVLEAMGAEVDYDARTGTVSAKRDGVELAMVPGQTGLVITENGETRTQEMDAAPYIDPANSRTYVPVRYAAEAFGYNVGWDADEKTVILVDVDALFGGATFELMDNFAAYCAKQEAGRNMSVTGNLSLDMTDKSGQFLPEPLKIKGSLDGVAGEKGVELTGKIDGAALGLIFGAVIGGTADTEGALQKMLNALPEVSAELRVDLDSKMLYASVPDISGLLTGKMENTWYSLDLGAYEDQLLGMTGMDMTQLAQAEGASIREALVMVMRSLPLDDSAGSYAGLREMAQLYAGMFSDQAFTRDGGTYTAKTALDDTVELEITLTKKGSDVVSMDLKMTASAEEEGLKMAVTMTEHASPDKVNMVMDMTMADDTAEVVLHMDMDCLPTAKTPQTQPPKGVTVTPLS